MLVVLQIFLMPALSWGCFIAISVQFIIESRINANIIFFKISGLIYAELSHAATSH